MIRKSGYATIKIYNIKGELIKFFDKEYYSAGDIKEWDGTIKQTSQVGTGIYLILIQGENFTEKHKLLIKK